MKKILIFILLIYLCGFTVFAQTYQELVSKAETAYNSKEYKTSNEFYGQAFKIETRNYSDLYNGACTAALSGDKEHAFEFLTLSIEKGWTNISHLQKDTDLTTLHSDKRWNILVENLQKKIDLIEAGYDKALQKELIHIYEEDQGIRQQFMESAKKSGYDHPRTNSLRRIMQYKDSINLSKITGILDERGWVGKDKIGAQANQAIFLVIQHADLSTQQKYLPMMREAVAKGNASGSALALLEDRVALGEGRKQIYGSQIGMHENRSYILPLEDPDNVDKRRADVGLGSISDYVKRWDIVWNPEEYKKQLPEIEKWNRKN
jgi:hypothetical protein